MSKPVNYKKKFVLLLEELYKNYPTYSTGQHLSTALAEYGDFWGITDKEICFALEKYAAELELDSDNIVSEDYMNKIVEDAKHLFDKQEDEEEY